MSTACFAAARCGSTAAGSEPDYRLQIGDRVRMPPVRVSSAVKTAKPAEFPMRLRGRGPAGDRQAQPASPSMAAAGSATGLSNRCARPGRRPSSLELAHRLDRDTSGLLMVCKKRSALADMHGQLREGGWRRSIRRSSKARPAEASFELSRTPAQICNRERRAPGQRAGGRQGGAHAGQGAKARQRVQPARGPAPHRPHAPDPRAPGARRASGAWRRQVRRFRRSTGAGRARRQAPHAAREAARLSCIRSDRRATAPRGAAARGHGGVRRPACEVSACSSSTGTARSSTRPAPSPNASGRRRPISGSRCRREEQASHVIGLGLHDALRYAVPDLRPERMPEFVARYRAAFPARARTTMGLFAGMRELLEAAHARCARSPSRPARAAAASIARSRRPA